MNITKKVTNIRLTKDSATIFTKEFVIIEGTELEIAKPQHASSYQNSASDREQLKNAGYPENIVRAVFEMWGNTPTMEDPQSLQPPEVQ